VGRESKPASCQFHQPDKRNIELQHKPSTPTSGPAMSKQEVKNQLFEEFEYKQKAGTAWSHNFLNQKPWHPLSYPNQRRKWIAEQMHGMGEKRKSEVEREVGAG